MWHNPGVTYVSDEAARLLLLEELADARPGFALQVIEVRCGALIHIMYMLLFQLGSFMIHPGNGATPKKCRSEYTAEGAEGGCRFSKIRNLQLPRSYCPYTFFFN